MSLKELTQKRAELVSANRALLDRADAETRQLNTEEQAEYDKRDAEIDGLTAQVDQVTQHETRRQRQDAIEQQLQRPLPRQIPRLPPGAQPTDGDGQPVKLTIGRHDLTLAAGSPAAELASDDYRRRFASYLTGSRDVDSLGLQVGKDPQGGYLAPISFTTRLIKFLDDLVFMRRLATVLPPMTSSASLGVLSWDTDPGDADWTPEVPAADISEDTSAALGKRELNPSLLTKLVKVSMKLLRASSLLDVETFITGRLGYKFGISEEKAFLTGDGVGKPLGVFTASADGISTARDTTASSATAFTADDLIEALYALKAAYQERATWLASREFVKRCRKLKTGDGQYIWQPGLVGQPDLLLNRPVAMNENAPNTFTTGLYVAVVGDFSFYWIIDSLSLEIQRLNELLALRNQVGLLGRKETDGMPMLAEAFSRLKLA